MSRSSGETRELSTATVIGFACGALAFVALLYSAVADLPFFSEDYTHLVEASRLRSIADALDPSLEPLRPLQHLFFYILAQARQPSPALARIPAFAFHLGSCALVYALARELGARRTGAIVATALFLAYPNVKDLAWSAAISGPGRVFFVLLGLVTCVRHDREPTLGRGVMLSTGFVLALGFHESAIVLPVLCALWIAANARGSWRAIELSEYQRLRDPWFVTLGASAAAFAVYLALLRPQRHHALKSLDSLPANVVKSAFALAPEPLRAFAVESFRGHQGAVGFALAATLLAVLAILVLACLRRNSSVARFAVLAVIADLVLPVLSTGFTQRYTYLSSAIVAAALGCWFSAQPSRARGLLIAILGALWANDLVRDVRDYRAAGEVEHAVIAQARYERGRVGPGLTIALVDLPDMWGSEQDLPLFNWGLPEALERERIGGPWRFWLTHEGHTSTSFDLVSQADVESARRRGAPRVLEYDPVSRELVRK